MKRAKTAKTGSTRRRAKAKPKAAKKWTTRNGQRVRTPAERKARKARNTKKGYYTNPVSRDLTKKAPAAHVVRITLGKSAGYFVKAGDKGGVVIDTESAKAARFSREAALALASVLRPLMRYKGTVAVIPAPK